MSTDRMQRYRAQLLHGSSGGPSFTSIGPHGDIAGTITEGGAHAETFRGAVWALDGTVISFGSALHCEISAAGVLVENACYTLERTLLWTIQGYSDGSFHGSGAMNAYGDLAGDFQRTSESHSRPAAVYRREVVQLEAGGAPGFARAINDAGTVVGRLSGPGFRECSAVAWRSGEPRELASLGGASHSAEAINNDGIVAGWTETADGTQLPCLWHEDGLLLQTLTPKGGGAAAGYGRATALNDYGVVVGDWRCASKDRYFPFVWQDGMLQNLNEITELPAGIRLTNAVAINARGQIAAHGHRLGAAQPQLGLRLDPL